MKTERFIVDTTLRDGEQSAGYAMTKEQKVFIASLLDEAGVYQIEAGIPAMGRYEKNTLCEIVSNKKNSLVSVWNRLKKSDIRHSIDCRPDIIHLSVPVSYPHIYHKLRKNKTWLKNSMVECVDCALSAGYPVTVGFEDASRADPTFMLSLSDCLKKMGVDRVRFADTVGILTPARTFQMIQELMSLSGVEIEMHAHNDLGMAVANSIAAAKAGAKYIDTTILGIGERTGNCDFQKLIYAISPAFALRPDHFAALTVEERASHILNKTERGA